MGALIGGATGMCYLTQIALPIMTYRFTDLRLKFPSIDKLNALRVGELWWTSIVLDPAKQKGYRFTNSHIWIRRSRGAWLVRFQRGSEILIAATWACHDGGKFDSSRLIEVSGLFGAEINSSLTAAEKTERIWNVLSWECADMECRISTDYVADRVSRMGHPADCRGG